MRALVYGAGVLGCLLAHRLHASGRADVTLLARGAWADTLERDGLTVRHVLQRRTTTDRVRIVRELASDDVYDLTFVVMQAGQVADVLPVVAAASAVRRVVFVGNNVDALGTAARLAELAARRQPGAGGAASGGVAPGPREVAFAFQSTGGRREAGRVVSVYARLGMTLGGADGPLSEGFRREAEGLLAVAGYRVTREDQMDAWLKCHLAFILPIAFVSYACGCNLRRATKAQRRAILDACREGYALLVARGIPIRPAGDKAYLEPGPGRAMLAVMVYVMAKTPLGRLAATDHCAHAVAEIRGLAQDFERLRTAAPTSDTVQRSDVSFVPSAALCSGAPVIPGEFSFCDASAVPDWSPRRGVPVGSVAVLRSGSSAASSGHPHSCPFAWAGEAPRSGISATSDGLLRSGLPAVPSEPLRAADAQPSPFAMPTWDALRAQMPSWDGLLIDPRCAISGSSR